jgi:hypothetical protein
MFQDHRSVGINDGSTPESEAALISGPLSLIESHVNFLLALGVPGGRKSASRKGPDQGSAAGTEQARFGLVQSAIARDLHARTFPSDGIGF